MKSTVDKVAECVMEYFMKEDPTQNTQIHDEDVEKRMKGYIKEYMKKNDAPEELYTRLGL